MPTARRLRLGALLALVALLAWGLRELNEQRIPRAPGELAAGWFSADPDSLYHMRRVERLLEDGPPVAGWDPFLAHPDGAAIPWPPYYTLAAGVLLAPGAPADVEARREWIERGMALLPMAFAVLTAVLLAAAAHRLAGAPAAIAAGVTFAALGASLQYSAPGNADHHAWAALLASAMLAALQRGMEREALAQPRAGLAWGALAGLAAGLLLGSWVGGLVAVVAAELALGWLVVANGRERLPALPWLGVAFHLAAGLAVLPAVLQSPWRELRPWIVVNLSWYHPAHLALGALVFAPLLALRAPRALRAWPWIVAGALALLGLLVAASELPFARGVREGFAWASREDDFMAYIGESQPLLWGQDGGFAVLARQLGYAALALPLAWMLAAARALRGRERALLPWVVCAPVLAVQALLQRRFAHDLGPVLALLVGWGAAQLLAALPRLRALPRWSAALAAGLLAALLQAPTLASTYARLAVGERHLRGPQARTWLAERELLEWMAANTPDPALPPERGGGYGVLASWSRGHAIEWVARRPSVATNFGSYVGEEAYLAPRRFFLCEDPPEAEELLRERRVRYVLITGGYLRNLEISLRLLRPGLRHLYLRDGLEADVPTPRWYGTLAARLLQDGARIDPERGSVGASLDFLRLVRVAPEPHLLPQPLALARRRGPDGAPEPVPAGWIYERVPGARLALAGAPGEIARARIDLLQPEGAHAFTWRGEALVGEDGVAPLRVPYATTAPNGSVLARGQMGWSVGQRSGSLPVPEEAVLEGLVLKAD